MSKTNHNKKYSTLRPWNKFDAFHLVHFFHRNIYGMLLDFTRNKPLGLNISVSSFMKFWTKGELKIKQPINVIEFNKKNINLYVFVFPLRINLYGQTSQTPLVVHPRSFTKAMIKRLIEPLNDNQMHIQSNIPINIHVLKLQTPTLLKTNYVHNTSSGSWNLDSIGVNRNYYFAHKNIQ